MRYLIIVVLLIACLVLNEDKQRAVRHYESAVSDKRAAESGLLAARQDKETAEAHAKTLTQELTLSKAMAKPVSSSAMFGYSSSLPALPTPKPVVSLTSLSSEFKLFPGHVNSFPTTFALRWLTPDSVVGVFTRNNEQYTLAGANVSANQIFASVNFNGRTVAYLKAKQTGNAWSGSMRVEDNGAIMPIDFQAAGKTAKTVTFKNDTQQKVFVCVGYFDSEQNLWKTKGYYNLEAGESCPISLRMLGDTYYYRATGSNNGRWDGEQMLAVGKHNAFTIRDADSRFPSFADEAADKNHDAEAEIETVGFAKRSFREGSNETKVTLTES